MNLQSKTRLKENLFLGIIAAAFLLFLTSKLTASQKKDLDHFPQRKKLVLFIIDFDSFFCLPCTDTFLNFCQNLPPFIQEEALWGVLVYEDPKKIENNKIHTRIVEKKLRGFIQANDIKFPIILDHFHIFDGLTKGGTGIIVFDQMKKIVRRYPFPLNQMQRDEILNFLTD